METLLTLLLSGAGGAIVWLWDRREARLKTDSIELANIKDEMSVVRQARQDYHTVNRLLTKLQDANNLAEAEKRELSKEVVQLRDEVDNILKAKVDIENCIQTERATFNARVRGLEDSAAARETEMATWVRRWRECEEWRLDHDNFNVHSHKH